MAAAPALAVKSGGGLASILGFGCARVDTPLSEALPNVPQPLRATLPASAPTLQTSSAGGVTISSIDNASPVSTVAVVLPGGSAYETQGTAGASKVLEQLAFKATTNRSTFVLTRELEKIGAVAYARAGRDNISFAVDACRIHASEATELLLDSVLNPKFHYWEVREAVEAVQQQLAQALAQPSNVLSEVVHRAAFEGGLGQPLLIDPSQLEGITNETLKEYASALLQPSKILLAGVGINHAEFKSLAQPLVEGVHAGAVLPAAKSAYLGGSVNVIADSPLTRIAFAFEAKGGLSDAKNAALVAVSRALLDNRVALPWTHKEGDILSNSSAFSNLYKDTGLVGITAAGAPQQAGALIDAVCKKVESLAKGVAEPQFKLAKQAALASYKASLATSSGAMSVIAPQLLATGKFDAADFSAKVEALTSSEVAVFVQKAIKTPTFVTYGSLSHLPRYESIAKRFN